MNEHPAIFFTYKVGQRLAPYSWSLKGPKENFIITLPFSHFFRFPLHLNSREPISFSCLLMESAFYISSSYHNLLSMAGTLFWLLIAIPERLLYVVHLETSASTPPPIGLNPRPSQSYLLIPPFRNGLSPLLSNYDHFGSLPLSRVIPLTKKQIIHQ